MISNIQSRGLTSDYKQYEYFRKENKELFDIFTDFPILPKNQKIKYLNKWDFQNFDLYKISYYVEPKLLNKAYLLIPKKVKEILPGILALHQHNDEYKAGKSEVIGMVKNPQYTKLEAVEPNRDYKTPTNRKQFAYAKELCERGYIVLAPDFISFEEYKDKNDYFNDPRFLRGYENLLAEKYILYGGTLLTKHMHDTYVAISILASLEKVDPKKIGIIGHSLGEEIASILTAFDRRIQAAVSSCGTICYDDFEKRDRMETAETIIPNFRKKSLDFDFFLDKIPPTQFLATNGKEDISLQGKKLLQKKRRNFNVISFDGSHGFPLSIRKKAYKFLDKALRD